ncbi:MAG: diaminopimelate epimerase [Mariprofundaceae bacterium]|nr:diaminopimelate epimerase [Mariprofundaceae bacterium]
MNTLPFHKMHAQGNDFVILDGRNVPLPELTQTLIIDIAERRRGIGCDQVLALLPDDDCAAAMRIFNNDGSEAETCGNGLRCAGALLLEEKGADSLHIRVGERTVRIQGGSDGICVHMGEAHIGDTTDAHVDVNIGNPHRVFFTATEEFPNDRNIEIVSGQIADEVYIDIIERGVGHTPACGSGACATAVAIWHQDKHQRPQHIHMPGGTVLVSGSANDVLLEGPVSFVCSGEYRLPLND